jgi:hypothetical protein
MQARQAVRGVALQMFVAGLAAEADLLAQVGHAKVAAVCERHESIELFHAGYGFSGHRPMCNFPVLSVTRLAGSNPFRLLVRSGDG